MTNCHFAPDNQDHFHSWPALVQTLLTRCKPLASQERLVIRVFSTQVRERSIQSIYSKPQIHEMHVMLQIGPNCSNPSSTSFLYINCMPACQIHLLCLDKCGKPVFLPGSKPPAFPHWEAASSWGGDCGRDWAANCTCQEKDRASHKAKTGPQ